MAAPEKVLNPKTYLAWQGRLRCSFLPGLGLSRRRALPTIDDGMCGRGKKRQQCRVQYNGIKAT